jgi:hypothetical protein
MAHPLISLDDDRVRALERVAAEEHVSLDEVIRRAVDVYLEQRTQDARPWAERFREVVQQFRADVPAGMTPDEIEAEITANWDEYRAERAAARDTASAPGDAGSR